MRAILLMMTLFSMGCGMPMSGGQCRDYAPMFMDCPDDMVEVCDDSSGCKQCSCVRPEDLKPSRPYEQTRRN